jgi:hypothetical protein
MPCPIDSKTMQPSHARYALLFLVVLLTRRSSYGSLGFVPPPNGAKATRPATALRYKSKDMASIANEIVDLEGGNVHKSASHDRNPWRTLLRSKHVTPPDDPATLVEMVRPAGEGGAEGRKAVAPAPTVESLQHDLFSLFQIAQQLTATELELANELAELERERNSIRRLVGRIFSLARERAVGRVRRLFRLAPKKKGKGTKAATE